VSPGEKVLGEDGVPVAAIRISQACHVERLDRAGELPQEILPLEGA